MAIIDEAEHRYQKLSADARSATYDAVQAADALLRIQIEARQRALELAVGSTPQDPHTGAKSEGHASVCKRAEAFYEFLTGKSPSRIEPLS